MDTSPRSPGPPTHSGWDPTSAVSLTDRVLQSREEGGRWEEPPLTLKLGDRVEHDLTPQRALYPESHNLVILEFV